ncbi:VOC family protein [Variovorax sp. Root411]|uniref:VOC family protein n=1 Tax=Variovorax sp. Root411 TaxID=1736530 RepID=UPI0006F40705|nr:VOC family protein [Variovorax sp. Root411]KQW63436.1 glyoxalase [Variovorax sp. Root411]
MSAEGISPQRLQNVYVVAQRPAELHAFYESALGLKLKFRDKDRWFQYGVGNTSVALACPEEAAPATSGVVMVFEVGDFAGAQERITGAGGEVIGMRDMGAHGAVMSLRDPEGNVVQLFKRAPAPAP